MERFQSSEAISASECGHVFHLACISHWLAVGDPSGECPQCRSTLDRHRLVRLYFTESSTVTSNDDSMTAIELREQLAIANERIHSLDVSHRQCSDLCVEQTTRLAQLEKQLRANESQLNVRHVEKLCLERACTGYKSQLEHCQVRIEHLEFVSERNATLLARHEQEREQHRRPRSASQANKNSNALLNG